MSNEGDTTMRNYLKIYKEKIDNAASQVVKQFDKKLVTKEEEISDLKNKIIQLQITHKDEAKCIQEKLEVELEKREDLKTQWEAEFKKATTETELEISGMQNAIDKLKKTHSQEIKCFQAKLEEAEEEKVQILHSRCLSQSALITQLLGRNRSLENELRKLKNIYHVEQPKDMPPSKSTNDNLQISTVEGNPLSPPNSLPDNSAITELTCAINSASPPNEVSRNEDVLSNNIVTNEDNHIPAGGPAAEITNCHESTTKNQGTSTSDLAQFCGVVTPAFNGIVQFSESGPEVASKVDIPVADGSLMSHTEQPSSHEKVASSSEESSSSEPEHGNWKEGIQRGKMMYWCLCKKGFRNVRKRTAHVCNRSRARFCTRCRLGPVSYDKWKLHLDQFHK